MKRIAADNTRLFPGCFGGDGRFDAVMPAYSPQIWCSDNTASVERQEV